MFLIILVQLIEETHYKQELNSNLKNFISLQKFIYSKINKLNNQYDNKSSLIEQYNLVDASKTIVSVVSQCL